MRAALVRAAVLAAPALGLPACTSHAPAATTPQTRTVVATATSTPASAATAPVSTGPTTAARATACPLLPKRSAADRVGMRLQRIVVLRSSGEVVGCRFYALQHSPLHSSERLPGPHQPAVEIDTTRYPSATAAHNAVVLEARRGTNPQPARIGRSTGVCFQLRFDAHDHGRDWACAFSLGATMVSVRTVVVSPALDVVEVARFVARTL